MIRKSHTHVLRMTENEKCHYLAQATRGSSKICFINTAQGTELFYQATILQVVVSSELFTVRKAAFRKANEVLARIKIRSVSLRGIATTSQQ